VAGLNPECLALPSSRAGYLGDKDKEAWKQYDATELMKAYKGPHLPMLVDQVRFL